MSARRPGCPAGCTASATTASSCFIDLRGPLWPHPVRPSRWTARCSRPSISCAWRASSGSTGPVVSRSEGHGQPPPSIPGRSRFRIAELDVPLGGRSACPSRSTRTPNIPRRCALRLPLPRPPPRAYPPGHHAPLADHRRHPAPDDRPGLHRAPHAHSDLELARGRARLPGAEPPASGQVLRPAPGRRRCSSSY